MTVSMWKVLEAQCRGIEGVLAPIAPVDVYALADQMEEGILPDCAHLAEGIRAMGRLGVKPDINRNSVDGGVTYQWSNCPYTRSRMSKHQHRWMSDYAPFNFPFQDRPNDLRRSTTRPQYDGLAFTTLAEALLAWAESWLATAKRGRREWPHRVARTKK